MSQYFFTDKSHEYTNKIKQIKEDILPEEVIDLFFNNDAKMEGMERFRTTEGWWCQTKKWGGYFSG